MPHGAARYSPSSAAFSTEFPTAGIFAAASGHDLKAFLQDVGLKREVRGLNLRSGTPRDLRNRARGGAWRKWPRSQGCKKQSASEVTRE